MPSLSTCNCFEVLSNIHDSETIPADVQKSETNPVSIPESVSAPTLKTLELWKLKWEKALPKQFTVATTRATSNSLKLKLEIETTNTVEKKTITALLYSDAMGEFIDRDYAKSCRFNLVKLTQPIPVQNVDGTLNEARSIMEAVSLILCYKNNSEKTLFCITNLGRQKMILRHSWLCKHNPEIDWNTGNVKMSWCPPQCCSGCRDKIRQERLIQKAESRRIDICSAGHHDSALDLELDQADLRDEPISIEEGDRILATSLLPDPLMRLTKSRDCRKELDRERY